MATQQSSNPSNLDLLRQRKIEKEAEELALKSALSYEKLATMTDYSKDLIMIMHRTVAKNTTNAELAYFLNVAKSVQLNPILKEIWCYKDNQGNLIVFTGRDGFLKKAQEDKRFDGLRSCEVCENDNFEINPITGEIKHSFTPKDRGKIVGAYCVVFIKNSNPHIEWVRFEEFDLKQANWKTKPATMIKKVAETHALKKAFGINGLQSEDDFTIKNDIAISKTEDAVVEVESSVINHERERLIKLIESAKDVESLKKFMKDCDTPELVEIYDARMKDLEELNYPKNG